MKIKYKGEENDSMDGKKKWYFPDGEIPPMGDDPDVYGHESLIVLNPNEEDAHVKLCIYWTDKDPVWSEPFTVEAQRVKGLRATEKGGFLGFDTPEGLQYAMLLESDVPVIVQYGRLDVRQTNMAFYTTGGYSV